MDRQNLFVDQNIIIPKLSSIRTTQQQKSQRRGDILCSRLDRAEKPWLLWLLFKLAIGTSYSGKCLHQVWFL